MDQPENRQEAGSASETIPSGKQQKQTRTSRSEQKLSPDSPGPGPGTKPGTKTLIRQERSKERLPPDLSEKQPEQQQKLDSAGSEPGSKPGPGSEPKTGPGTKPEPGPGPGTKSGLKSGPGTKPGPGPGLGTKLGHKSGPGTKPGPGPGLGTKLGHKSGPGTKPGPGPGLGTKLGHKSGHGSKPGPGITPGPAPGAGPSPRPKPEPRPKPGPGTIRRTRSKERKSEQKLSQASAGPGTKTSVRGRRSKERIPPDLSEKQPEQQQKLDSAGPEPGSKPEPEPEPEPEPGLKPELEPEPGSKPEPGPEALSKPEPESKPEPGPETEREPEPGHKPEPGPEPGPEPEPGFKPGLEPEPASKPGLGSEPDVNQQSSEGLSHQSHPPKTDLTSIFMSLEQNMVQFVKKELKKIEKVLSEDGPEGLKNLDLSEGMLGQSSKNLLLNMTINFLKDMKHENLAENLQKKTNYKESKDEIRSKLKKKLHVVFDEIVKTENQNLLNQINITEGERSEVNDEHEVRQIEAASRKRNRPKPTIRPEDVFKPPGREEPIRTVMTKGVAGIGKTVLTQKFTLDWAEDRTNQDIHFLFPFTFRELNVLKEKKFSLVELLHHFFTETEKAEISIFEDFQVLFIFDGLDECRLPLDFHNNEILTDVTESTSVDVLLTNLIRGKLLPAARLWITTRPAAANQIPPECVGMVTEIRGFTDPQKEEYFRKRFREKERANRIISHIKTSRSLHIMCHIPVFCWITATVLEDVLKTRDKEDLPRTLTEMYIHFLVVQTKVKKVKYDGGAEAGSHWSPETRKMIWSLCKLAFEQLQRGNLIFYESDLTECDIITAASVTSGVFTQIFKEERGLYQDKVFCFIHLSVQEFLAALHVHLTFINSGVNLLEEQARERPKLTHVHQDAVDKALQSPNGHLDMFLRFLLGLSLPANQTLLRGLLMQRGSSLQTNQETVQFIKNKISENLSVEKSINLFHCLNEMNDHSLLKEIQQFLKTGSLSTDKLSPAQWSALVFILLSSEKDLDTFDLKKYSASEEALLRLLPVVEASDKALLSVCNLSERSCEALSSVLSSESSNLMELDLSNNNLKDSGVKILSAGLRDPKCKLEVLSLSGCLITKEGCASLASALSSNPSHLRELDLSYNHPGDSGSNLLSDGLQDPQWRLETLRLDHGGDHRLNPGLKKYSCELKLDTNSVNQNVKVSDDNRKMTLVNGKQPYPDHPERFEFWQLLCRDSLIGRCYWEVEWSGGVRIAVSYKGIRRKGKGNDCKFGGSDVSWSLSCSDGGYSISHRDVKKFIPSSSVSHRVAVYVDYSAGTLSFYRVSSDSLVHLHTFTTTFTEPLYAGFGFSSYNSSVSLQ